MRHAVVWGKQDIDIVRSMDDAVGKGVYGVLGVMFSKNGTSPLVTHSILNISIGSSHRSSYARSSPPRQLAAPIKARCTSS
jgi:hypothetical protein